uniref:Uncharacterized protein n=2 Tax=Clytia hemisphaerica TaxID=252671 RepID=A0A7M5XGN5_9CNID
ILIGDKLGSPTLPAEIPEDEFEMFLRLLKTFEPNLGGSILKRLYIKNNNTIPPVYSLQNITDVQLQDSTTTQKPSYKKWMTQTKQIHNLLHRAATIAREKQLMSDEITEKYLLS